MYQNPSKSWFNMIHLSSLKSGQVPLKLETSMFPSDVRKAIYIYICLFFQAFGRGQEYHAYSAGLNDVLTMPKSLSSK